MKRKAYKAMLAIMTILLSGCQIASCKFEPSITYTPQARLVEALPSPFPKLTIEEVRKDWGKELLIGLNFATELDLYRAITAFKRSLILLPANRMDRREQIEYSIMECYYLGLKYVDALDIYQKGRLNMATERFPAYRDMLIMLYDCYQKTDQCEKAALILEIIETVDKEAADRLKLSTAFIEGDLVTIPYYSSNLLCHEPIDVFLNGYYAESKSVQKAKVLQAVLPGAGYWYVGQKKTAVTSLLLNALFTWAAYSFFKNGNTAAGVFTASLESGWYLGGINGAGLAANEYNLRLYETNAKELMVQNRLFPVLLLEKSF